MGEARLDEPDYINDNIKILHNKIKYEITKLAESPAVSLFLEKSKQFTPGYLSNNNNDSNNNNSKQDSSPQIKIEEKSNVKSVHFS